jgi:uncharacterized protein
MPNRLAGEKSPYLLQHAENPVDWYPWGDEAFRKATEESKPVFLSIGYSTCHWCHVMEHESFEDDQVADLLNRYFVAIKVDREERPDIDQVYMTVCQATTGAGGWPLSIFMAPDKRPFFAGSYFPKTSRQGMPGFMDILHQLAALWKDKRGQLDRISEEITRAIQPKQQEGYQSFSLDVIGKACRELRKSYDPVWGGFGTAPKFPTPHNLSLLLRWHKRRPDSGTAAVVEKTLTSMRAGGIFDQVGFGFHRYSVDEKWLVPHFEKMLYDQAMLALAYADAFLTTGRDRYARVVREIFAYVTREMQSPEGGFYCAEDADSEGREGIFYTWVPGEIAEIVGKKNGEIFCRAYGITDRGNFEEGRSIPHIPKPLEELAGELGMSPADLETLLEDCRVKLFAAREKRIHPHKDDKILVAWNGLMIAALARGYQALGDKAYAGSAVKAADFILDTMRPGGGRLHRRYRQGEIAYPAYADDYAFLIWGLLELYESIFEIKYLTEAIRLQEQMNELFEDRKEGGFFFSGQDSESMIVREKVIYDGAVPSSNSVAALNLLRLGRMTGNTAWEEQADLLLKSFATQVQLFPPAYTSFLQAVDFSIGPSREIVVAGKRSEESTKEMIASVHRLYLPNRVLLLKEDGTESDGLAKLAPYTAAMHAAEDGPAAFVCEKYRCGKPVFTTAGLKSAMEE